MSMSRTALGSFGDGPQPPDAFTLRHLRAWIAEQFPGDDAAAIETVMVAEFVQDPEYWGGKGWWLLYDAVAPRDR